MYNKIDIEYDEAKSLKNQKERGLPFSKVVELNWDAAFIAEDLRANSERRYVALAPLTGRLHVVCYTWRGSKRRIISFRKANKREENLYEKLKQ